MKIFLIRHANSEANKNKSLLLHTADHSVKINPERAYEAICAGKFLNEYFKENINPLSRTRMWVSPYTRTRQTAEIILDNLDLPNFDKKEHPLLSEQQFGLFDGYRDEELATIFPKEWQYYQKHVEQQGIFWPKTPSGESRFCVAQRVHQAFGTFHRDCDRHGIQNIIIVSHGVTIRAFIMMWMHYTPEWFNEERNPSNCSIQLIDGNDYVGYIHGGPKP